MNVCGKVALITGAADGIGRAVTEGLLKKRIKAVGFLDIQQEKGESTLKQLADEYGEDRVHFILCDVTNKQQLEEAFREIKGRFGQIDLVFNNAGIADESNWEKVIDINLTAVVRGTLLAIEYMGKENGGRGGVIINTGSVAGLKPAIYDPVYAATKHGVVGLTRSLAGNHKVTDENIRINTLCPAFVYTELVRNAKRYKAPIDAKEKMILKYIPVSMVVEAFMKLVEEDLNGQAMTVTEANGTEVHQFAEIKLYA